MVVHFFLQSIQFLCRWELELAGPSQWSFTKTNGRYMQHNQLINIGYHRICHQSSYLLNIFNGDKRPLRGKSGEIGTFQRLFGGYYRRIPFHLQV